MSKLYQIIFDKSSQLHVHCMYCMYLGWSFLWNYVPWCKSNVEITAGCIQARQRFTVVSIFSVKKTYHLNLNFVFFISSSAYAKD